MWKRDSPNVESPAKMKSPVSSSSVSLRWIHSAHSLGERRGDVAQTAQGERISSPPVDVSPSPVVEASPPGMMPCQVLEDTSI